MNRLTGDCFPFYPTFLIWFSEAPAHWKEQTVLGQLISSCRHKRLCNCADKSMKPYWHISLYVVSIEVLCADYDHIMRFRLVPTPMRFTEAMLFAHGWVLIIHHCAGDTPLNPECHCSQIEVSKCAAAGNRTHFPWAQQSSWRRCSRFMEGLAGIVN